MNNVEIKYYLLADQEFNRPWENFDGICRVSPIVIKGFRTKVFSREIFFFNNVNSVLNEINPDLIVLTPWSEPPLYEAKNWAKHHQKICIAWVMGPRKVYLYPFDRIRVLISRYIIRKFVSGLDELFCYGKGVSIEINRITGFPLSKMTCVKHSVDNFTYEISSLSERNSLNSIARDARSISKDKFIFGFVGQLIMRKGITTLLESCQKLDSLGYKFKLCILGRGPLENLVLENQLYKDGKIIVIPRLHTRELKGFYSMISCMIVPSLFDDWCTVVNESFHSRTPVICSTGAYSHFDLIEDRVTGLRFNAANSEQLLECMKLAISNPELLENMTTNAYHKISSWTIDESAKIWHDRIINLLGDNGKNC
ncbi:MAG: glycosyltransferase family 4 protein [Cyanobacteria bacterium REEB459]|nr:glycosyltransferase family 4 protein [Cyanobacteria bacterium REEB459]